ncbi:MAG: FIST signal transduction protein [Candidatus Hodarchaeota archaeon]
MLKVGVGYSTKANSTEAGTEAAKAALEKLGDAKPTFTIAFCTVQHDEQAVVKAINSVVGEIPLWGGTSLGGVYTPDGFIEGPDGSVGVMVISSPDIVFGVGSTEVKGDGVNSGEIAIKKAMDAAGKKEPPSLFLMTSAIGAEEGIIRGISSVIGSEVFPLVGGTSADNTIEGNWKQFAGKNVYSNHVVIGALYTDLKVGFSYGHGYKPVKSGKVTKAEGRTLYEIDGRPAAEVYAEWTGKSLDSIKGGKILSESFFAPFGVPVKNDYRIVHMINVGDDGSIACVAAINEGDEVFLMESEPNILIEETGKLFERALEIGKITKLGFGLLVHCAGRRLALGDKIQQVIDQMKSTLGEAPFIGFNTFGEQACTFDAGAMHCNLVLSAAVVGTEKK